jgi:ribosomal-protein-alanine N-acetyltransferase
MSSRDMLDPLRCHLMPDSPGCSEPAHAHALRQVRMTGRPVSPCRRRRRRARGFDRYRCPVQLPSCLRRSRVDLILYTEWSDEVSELSIRLRPVIEDDLEMFRRFAMEPDLVGLDWAGFRDAGAPARRFAADGYLGEDDSRLMVEVDEEHTAAGFVSWRPSGYGVAKYWEIGIALLPEWRGRGIGWRAQAMLCDYLFHHTPAERIEARTHVENIAEQKALEKAGFRREGLLRSAEFRAGQWRDGWIYSRLRGEHPPL